MRTRFLLATAGLAALLTGCETVGSKQIIGVEATGTAIGMVYIDLDGDGHLGSLDGLAPNIPITLTRRGALRPSARALTDSRGVYRITDVPVGSYWVGIDSTALGDSLHVVRIDSAAVTVAKYDSAVSRVTLGIRPVSIANVRGEPLGKLVSVEGIALSGSGTFGDTTVHIADGSGALRITQLVTGGLEVGDSIRVIGRTGTRNGQTVVLNSATYRLGKTAAPKPDSLSTHVAAKADGGKRDAALVRVTGTLVTLDASSADLKLTVNDGSGPIEVFIDRYARITSSTPLIPGVAIDATGLLVPLDEGSGRWRLKPRGTTDLRAEVPEFSIEAVRRGTYGTMVSFTAVAVNAWSAFGDSTVHLVDPTGAIRSIRVAPIFLFAGDSVRVTGVVSLVATQPTMMGPTLTVLGKSQVPPPASIETGVAANANGGVLDAALVRVRGTVRDSSVVSGGGVTFTINDESGLLTVFIDLRTGIGTGPWRKDSEVQITGVLVPRPDGRSWFLKPRTRDDITK